MKIARYLKIIIILDSVGEGEGGMFWENSIKTCILSRVKQITSPGGMHETSAWAWYTGKTQKNRVEREVGGGIGMGNTCKSMADSCQWWQKPLQYCKVISLQLIKINGKKKKTNKKIKYTWRKALQGKNNNNNNHTCRMKLQFRGRTLP